MSQFFWQSVQKARREYFCDMCHNWIEVGQTYKREMWAPPGTRSWHVMREHVTPECPFDFEQEFHQVEVMTSLPIVLALEVRYVVKIGLNGEFVTEPETHTISRFVCETIIEDEDEIPF